MPTYTHHDKAGNEGDVAKHAALIEVIRTIASRVGTQRGVRYADTHAAFAVHNLPKKGSWDNGINKIVGDSLKEYLACSFHSDSGFGRSYLGSSALVSKWLLDNGHPFPDLLLFDILTEPCHDLFDYFATVHEADPILLSQSHAKGGKLSQLVGASSDDQRVIVVRGDSYNLLPTLISDKWKPDFVLVDPPQIDFEEPSEAKAKKGITTPKCNPLTFLQWLKSRDIPFMCWTPINANGDPQHQDNLTKPTEYMLRHADRNFDVRVFFWLFSGAQNKTKGCQLTFYNCASAYQLDALCNNIIKAMPDWVVGTPTQTIQGWGAPSN